MNETALFWIGHYAKKLHCDGFVYRVAKLFSSRKVLSDVKPLDTFWPDKGTSCICSNSLAESPLYDLQIVVPCYNVEEYVAECIESILGQKTKYSCKVVIVNDGSTDSTRKILSRYEGKPSVQIIDRQNGGLSAARNAGIHDIDARYLLFVDSDDVLMPNAVEALLNRAYELDADIVEGGYERFQGGRILHSCPLPDSRDNRGISGFAWGKIYKSKLFRGLRYPENYWFEDTLGCMLLFEMAESISTIPDIVYRWRKNRNSITSLSRGNIKCVDAYWITKRLLEDRLTLSIPNNPEFINIFLNQVKGNCVRVSRLGNSEISMSVFNESCGLYDLYFEKNTGSDSFASLLQALRTRDYMSYLIECLL